jgi:hypothetical protein
VGSSAQLGERGCTILHLAPREAEDRVLMTTIGFEWCPSK